MDCCSCSPVLKNFQFISSDNNFQIQINENILIPLQNNVNYREISHRLIESSKIPVFVENELTEKLKNFIDEETDRLHDIKVDSLLEEFNKFNESNNELNCDLINYKFDKTDIYDKSSENCNENNEFYNMYHELIHSGIFTESLMKFENSYSVSVQDLISSRDQSYQELLSKQTIEMEEAIKKIGMTFNEENINTLSMKHFEESEKLKDDWNNAISNLKYEQKQEFREWIHKVYEDYKNGNQQMVTNFRSLSVNSNERMNLSSYDEIDWNNSSNGSNSRMEESFTINLGAQLKTTHNLRLISMDIMDFCSMKHSNDFSQYTPQRIQTSMSLYSNSLNALVLLVDNRINSYSGIKLEFANTCSMSTEFHFPELEIQMNESRKMAEKLKMNENNSKLTLQTGDFYITKHSNLSEVHVVYHLVSDDSLRSSDINSRHPVILGLRNIMKISHLNDISHITIPLLLIHEMTEEITIQWCLKRAELVLKCVKGFMIEMASLSTNNDENKTVQFIVPKGISQELFSSLTTILPSIFRLSNTLVLRPSCVE